GHRTTIRTGLTEPTLRMLNQGIDITKSETAQIEEAIANLEDRSAVDVDLAKLNGNTSEFRLSENKAHLQGFNQKVAQLLFYGNTLSNPASFVGFGPRFNDLGAQNGEHILDAGGTGADDNTSIWLVGWSPETVFTVYPKGSTAGLSHEDMGVEYVPDRDGKMFRAYRDHWQWKIGLVLRDWRHVVRIANINMASLSVDPKSTDDGNLIVQLTRAVERVKTGGNLRIYCSQRIREFLRLQSIHHKNVRLGIDEVAGRKVLHFDGIIIRRVDQIMHTEGRVVNSQGS